ncbi:hypothetical protein BSKO_09737 [Bryopsis sp. KO-2023]|nr:hypothetical protein BSKO_09737 [Bryopsis sp. KO-2023]
MTTPATGCWCHPQPQFFSAANRPRSVKTVGKNAFSAPRLLPTRRGKLLRNCLVSAAAEEVSKDGENSLWGMWDLYSSGDRGNHRKDLHVVLVNPSIPQNTGNIARTCAATRVGLHLVEPLGFDTDSRKLRRAGLDFWPYVVVNKHKSWEAFREFFEEIEGPKRLVAFTKFADTLHMEPEFIYRPGDWLVFGSESTGLPDEAHDYMVESGGARVKIPMEETHVRCLNLAASVGIGVYEALRQLDYPRGLQSSK